MNVAEQVDGGHFARESLRLALNRQGQVKAPRGRPSAPMPVEIVEERLELDPTLLNRFDSGLLGQAVFGVLHRSVGEPEGEGLVHHFRDRAAPAVGDSSPRHRTDDRPRPLSREHTRLEVRRVHHGGLLAGGPSDERSLALGVGRDIRVASQEGDRSVDRVPTVLRAPVEEAGELWSGSRARPRCACGGHSGNVSVTMRR